MARGQLLPPLPSTPLVTPVCRRPNVRVWLHGVRVCGIGQVRLCVRVCVDVTWIARRR